jgi:hypothetical protein
MRVAILHRFGVSRWGLVIMVALAMLAGSASVARAAALSWSAPIPLEGTSNVHLNGVACPSATQCTAVNGTPADHVNPGITPGQEVTFNPTAPGTPTPVTIDSGAFLGAVACPSVTECVAVASFGGRLTFNPTSPGTPTPVATGSGVFALACPSVTQCTGVGPTGYEVTFDPTSSTVQAAVQIDTGSGNGLDAVACPSTSQCTALDGATSGREITFDPNAPGSPVPVVIDGATPTGLACPSTIQCTAVDSYGREVTFNPTSPPAIPTLYSFTSTAGGAVVVACASMTACLMSVGGHAVVGDPGNPSGFVSDDSFPSDATSLTCVTEAECVATNEFGQGFVGMPAPVDLSLPSVSGSPVQGQTLTEANGSWSPTPTGYAYQWLRCDGAGANCVSIAGAIAQTYTLTAADVGSTIRVQETANSIVGASVPASSATTALVTAVTSGGGSPPPPSAPPPPPPAPPKVTGYRITSNPFVASAARTPLVGSAAAKRPAHKRGASFKYTLSEAATVKIAISVRLPGRRSGTSCVAPTQKLRHARVCTRIVARGTLTRTSHTGANTVAFSGRIGSRALKPGHYQATLTATDTAKLTSNAETISFTIVTR